MVEENEVQQEEQEEQEPLDPNAISESGSDVVTAITLTADQQRVIDLQAEIEIRKIEKQALEDSLRLKAAVEGLTRYEVELGGTTYTLIVPHTANTIAAHSVPPTTLASLDQTQIQALITELGELQNTQHVFLSKLHERLTS